jgi:hypothetical protein
MEEQKTAPAVSGHGNHSGQWGLASVLLSGLVLVLFPLMIFLMFVAIWGAYEDPFVESRDIDLGVTAAYLLVAAMLGLALFALACAVAGLATSLFRKQAVGLSVAGTVSSLSAVVVAVVLLLVGLRCIEWVRSLQRVRYEQHIQQPSPEQLRR